MAPTRDQYDFDVIIIGGGVTGTALLYVLTHFTNVRRILIIERRRNVALVNSNTTNNSQTLHDGSIETNYPLDRALKVQRGAELLSGFIDRQAPDVGMRIPKMVIAVDHEVPELERRFAEFSPYFPGIKLLRASEIEKVEPGVMQGRKPTQNIVALSNAHGHAVDYHRLSERFLALALETNVYIDRCFDTDVEKIERTPHGFVIRTTDGTPYAGRTVAVAAGSGSLVFAQMMGYGREYVLMPVTGSFYKGQGLLKGKVYTMQDPAIPFAAVHGDPAVYNPDETRFGPTAMMVPLLERHRWATFPEFHSTGTLSPAGLWAIARVLSDPHLFGFGLKNVGYELPWFGTRMFLKSAQKVVPSLELGDLILDQGAGGVRGQLVDKRIGRIAKGADKIVPNDGGIIFTMAPSPGASYCLGNAEEDARRLVDWLDGDFRFDNQRLRSELTNVAA